MPDIVSHRDFIGIYDNALSEEECCRIINDFNKIELNANEVIELGKRKYGNELNRQDFSIYTSRDCPEIRKFIGDKLHNCLLLYLEEFFVAKSIPMHSIEVKLQRTPPRGGYHIWHAEQGPGSHADRVLVWTIYLNDIPSNEGETEFLWQGVRINPKAGRCVIWPAAFTHTHRGNPVYAHDKYIATGWYTLMN